MTSEQATPEPSDVPANAPAAPPTTPAPTSEPAEPAASAATTSEPTEPEPPALDPDGQDRPEPAATLAITTPQTATKVRIDTPGVTIEIEAHEPLDSVVTTAMRVFHEAGGWPQHRGHSTGFAASERRDTPPVQPSSMPYAPGAYPVQWP